MENYNETKKTQTTDVKNANIEENSVVATFLNSLFLIQKNIKQQTKPETLRTTITNL